MAVGDVLVLGGAGVDTIVYVPELPLPFKDSYMLPGIEMRAGQTGDNAALGLRALGLRTSHIGVLGDDREGERVRALHEAHGVPLLAVPTAAGTQASGQSRRPRRPTGVALRPLSRGGDADRLPAEVVAAHAARARLVHVARCGSRMSWSGSAVRGSGGQGVRTSLPRTWPPWLMR